MEQPLKIDGIGYGTFGWVVTSDTKDLRFNSSQPYWKCKNKDKQLFSWVLGDVLVAFNQINGLAT